MRRRFENALLFVPLLMFGTARASSVQYFSAFGGAAMLMQSDPLAGQPFGYDFGLAYGRYLSDRFAIEGALRNARFGKKTHTFDFSSSGSGMVTLVSSLSVVTWTASARYFFSPLLSAYGGFGYGTSIPNTDVSTTSPTMNAGQIAFNEAKNESGLAFIVGGGIERPLGSIAWTLEYAYVGATSHGGYHALEAGLRF